MLSIDKILEISRCENAGIQTLHTDGVKNYSVTLSDIDYKVIGLGFGDSDTEALKNAILDIPARKDKLEELEANENV